ncbi:MAG: Fic family protein [Bacteroidetes bacterium]|jgi:Fic family protein|nr:Fic family protein [Bacteroidota bacterium]NBY30006.1 Fic family protein [Sphingobacteriia bacterium]
MRSKDPSEFEKILLLLQKKPLLSSKEIHDFMDQGTAYATLKRTLQVLLAQNLVRTTGKGKSTKYSLSSAYELLRPVDVEAYFQQEIDERIIKMRYNPSLIVDTLTKVNLFTETEQNHLRQVHQSYGDNIRQLSANAYALELERLAIDLSWKSSQIEGNTYTLLETERLLREKRTAEGKSKDEATMLLNHKEAIDFIIAQPSIVEKINVAIIEDMHSILVQDLGIDRNIRKWKVGISGSNYVPLDNDFQILEALEAMVVLINNESNVMSKALLALVLISYIQPFADGNKRTARMISNAILMHHQYCPLSYRTVDAMEYKKAMLIFYEQNNISPMKTLFIQQYEFAVKTYF